MRLGKLVVLVILVITVYWALYWAALAISPIGDDIDFDGDGYISLMEALDGAELQTRAAVVQGKHCVEYITPRDGRTWRRICPP
jgi:hypothetical protein